jgi:hypothetical protein
VWAGSASLVVDLVEGGGDCCEERDVEVEKEAGGKGECEVRSARACARSRGRE